jgi:hypothetical protein
VEVLKMLIDAMKRARGELWRDSSLILRHDNALEYSALRVSQFLAGKGIFATDHPPCPPDLAPADFWLLPELKGLLQGKRFSDVEDFKSFVQKF